MVFVAGAIVARIRIWNRDKLCCRCKLAQELVFHFIFCKDRWLWLSWLQSICLDSFLYLCIFDIMHHWQKTARCKILKHCFLEGKKTKTKTKKGAQTQTDSGIKWKVLGVCLSCILNQPSCGEHQCLMWMREREKEKGGGEGGGGGGVRALLYED